MKLYFSKGACSLTVRIILNELNISCDYEAVDLRSKKTASGEDYLKINPKGVVAALEIRDEIILTENVVILQYLADSNKALHLLPAVGDFYRYRVLEWLNFITTDIHKSFGPLFNPEFPQEVKDKFVMPLLNKRFDYVSAQLNNHEYLMGSEFTLPDAYLFVMLTWMKKFPFDGSKWPNLMRYFELLKKRPSVMKSLQQEGLI